MKIFLIIINVFFCFSAYAQDSSAYRSEEIIYGRKDGMALTMLKFSPGQNSKGKAIISVVSGNWVSGYSQVPGYTRRSEHFVKAGYTVFLVMHGSQPRYDISDEVRDIKRAVRFIRYNAKLYGIDPTGIGITGSSSGGHLSLMTALSADSINIIARDPVDRVSSRVQAAAVFFPPTDFLNWGKANSGINREAIKRARVAGAFDFKVLSDSTGMYEHVPGSDANIAIGRAMSPVNHVSADDPPVLFIHGDADPVVPLQQSQTLVQKLKGAGVIHELIVKPGGRHGWAKSENEEKKFAEWFDKYLK